MLVHPLSHNPNITVYLLVMASALDPTFGPDCLQLVTVLHKALLLVASAVAHHIQVVASGQDLEVSLEVVQDLAEGIGEPFLA